MALYMEELLQLVFDRDGSDLHIAAGVPPMIRVNGKLQATDYEPLTHEDTQKLIFSILTNEQRKTLEQTWELDCSYGVVGLGRFRVNVYKDKGAYAAALRTIATKIPRFEDLGMAPIVRELTHKPRGLILVTGPTGSGKSTTLASMIDFINGERHEHILTIEDPIEFIHPSKKSLVNQRELGADTKSFDNALKAALREDPDVILVGEMRDLETIRLALSAAETGHLVFGTLHTSSASQTVDRIVDVFPPHQQQQIRVQLSNSLQAVLSQCLLPRLAVNGKAKGRVMAQEIMTVTPAIANLIREAKTAQMYSSIQTGSKYGMITLEAALKNLYDNKLITFEDALLKTSRPDDFMRMCGVAGGH
ncbi:MAG: type IV pilus twitching motility protein PilT [Candidatus Sericytochromatia bacterium]|nr:type IV pilus twitching motility protein PilT [Candidatus Sericytochromatia bacterium]